MTGPRRPPRPATGGAEPASRRASRPAPKSTAKQAGPRRSAPKTAKQAGPRRSAPKTAASPTAESPKYASPETGSPRRRRGRLMGAMALTVLLIGVLFVAVFPTSTWWNQHQDTMKAEAQLREIQAESVRVRKATERLGTDAEIEAQARRSGYVRPGEEAYYILPQPVAPIGLPDTWPFTGVEQALGAK